MRGKIIDAEDFSPIKDTYPEYCRGGNSVQIKTSVELKAKRHEEIIVSLQKSREEWSRRSPDKVVHKYANSEFLVSVPKYLFVRTVDTCQCRR